ncbi:MAG: phosphate ABC transporter permease subunit PstC [Dehalococcoidales bacterium]|jgi:phosphate transport system permease protein|nr:phosphate ABC transporter permease subunit PstC [Dehalococcoidales bacterium]MDD3265256.1 phosphate ABC transporter permease subunit PstC [Dehalococcoidales bacterium]MDD4794628.1 phosphate ABC transporter permease subunit PstC [Dehalococcoidales bacterium]MDD5122035.1 phosphate ABC transporter permease subunit PstC [Dehalococcoidales bacterium]MDD5498460.1 phosphate ABC transporter permease subunit PstC [Dehalococcoidales bacterium]
MINMFPSLKKGIGKTASLTSPRPRWGERIIEKLILFNGILAIAVLLGVFFILLRQGIPALIETPFYSFLFGTHWYPVSDPPTFGILPFFVATMWVTVISTVLAVPIGVGAAIFLAEVAPRKVADAVKPVVELLSGFPSVVMGFIGLVLLSPWVQNTLGLSSGLCGVTAGIMLAMMSLPIIVSVSEDALRAVPDEFRQAAYGLGSTRWEVIWHVCVPSALSGISAAIMLGIGRAIGETMTVLMVAGGALALPGLPTDPMMPMTAAIASGIGNAVQGGPQYHALFAIGLILFILTLFVNLIAARILDRQRRKFAAG